MKKRFSNDFSLKDFKAETCSCFLEYKEIMPSLGNILWKKKEIKKSSVQMNAHENWGSYVYNLYFNWGRSGGTP